MKPANPGITGQRALQMETDAPVVGRVGRSCRGASLTEIKADISRYVASRNLRPRYGNSVCRDVLPPRKASLDIDVPPDAALCDTE